jgi:large subunit ribosomal protein L22
MEPKEFKYLNATTSCQKANLIVPLIKSKSVSKALENLEYSDKKASVFWKKLIKSALGFYDGKDLAHIKIVEAYTGPAPTLKRGRPSAKLHYSRILKRRSNLYIKLAEQIQKNGK